MCIRYKYIYIYLHIQHLKISCNSLSNEINHLQISSKKNLVASEKVFVNIVLITVNQKKKMLLEFSRSRIQLLLESFKSI